MAEMKSLQALIIALVVIGIVLGIGFTVLIAFEDQLGDTLTTVSNETIVPTDTGVFVDNNYTTAGIGCYNTFTILIVTNESDGTIITSANYTSNPLTGSVTNLSSYSENKGWNVSYTYLSDSGEGCTGLNDTIEATATIPTWLTLIALIIIVGIILFIVFKVMPQGGGGYSGSESSGVTAQI